jgi:hypothetical protein
VPPPGAFSPATWSIMVAEPSRSHRVPKAVSSSVASCFMRIPLVQLVNLPHLNVHWASAGPRQQAFDSPTPSAVGERAATPHVARAGTREPARPELPAGRAARAQSRADSPILEWIDWRRTRTPDQAFSPAASARLVRRPGATDASARAGDRSRLGGSSAPVEAMLRACQFCRNSSAARASSGRANR